VSVAVGAVSGGEVRADTPVTATAGQNLQDELRFRRDFGLNTDEGTVRALMAQPSAYTTYPVALTPDERAEMDRRIAMESQMTPLEDASERMPAFAGHWIDQPAGGIIVVAFANDAEKREAELRPLVPPGAELQVRNVDYTVAELEAVRLRIANDLSKLSQAGIGVRLLYTDLPSNRVVIGLADPNSIVTARLNVLYGDGISTTTSNPVLTACTARENCYGPPLRAGISGAPVGTLINNRCSIAFLVKQSANVQWLTAGHCAQTIGTVWYHAANGSWPIGDIKATCWPQCNYSDAARGGNINSIYASRKVYSTGVPAGYQVSSAQGYNGDNNGNYVCLNARKAELWRCGYIQNDNAYVCYQGNPCTIWFWEQRLASYASMYGDSGGAVHSNLLAPQYTSVTALGVHSGCTNLQGLNCVGNGIYSHIYRVAQELGVVVCSAFNPCP
jgi:hypothetical protein